eukprot:4730361-Alexandrium_andersonii.AAC.1
MDSGYRAGYRWVVHRVERPGARNERGANRGLSLPASAASDPLRRGRSLQRADWVGTGTRTTGAEAKTSGGLRTEASGARASAVPLMLHRMHRLRQD